MLSLCHGAVIALLEMSGDQMIQLVNSGWTKNMCVVGGGMGVLCWLGCVFIARL